MSSMKALLIKHNYEQVELNVWVRGNWTVRFDNDLVEIFSDPDKTTGKYYKGTVDEIKIKDYLEEIDTYLIDKVLLEPGIMNQVNQVPIYSYKKLTVEMLEEAILKTKKDFESSLDRKWVVTVFGTVEQTTKYMEDFNNAMRNYLKEIE